MDKWLIAAGLMMLALPACEQEQPSNTGAAQDGGDGNDDGADDGNDDGNDDGGDDGATPQDASDALTSAHVVPQAVVTEGQSSASVAAESVWLASQLGGVGQLVTTGTLTQQPGGFSYDAQPGDKLVVHLMEGTTVELRIHTMNGDLAGTASGFLDGDHDFDYDVAVDDKIDMRYHSQRSQGAIAASANGSYTDEGVAYDTDLELQGTYFFESDSTGTHLRDEHRTSGTVRTDGYRLDVDETWFYELVTSGNGSASSARRTVNSGLTLRNTVFDWVDVVTQKSFRDGRPSQLDTYWTAEGEILRDGDAYGRYGIDIDGAFALFVVALPDQTIEVEKHQLY